MVVIHNNDERITITDNSNNHDDANFMVTIMMACLVSTWCCSVYFILWGVHIYFRLVHQLLFASIKSDDMLCKRDLSVVPFVFLYISKQTVKYMQCLKCSVTQCVCVCVYKGERKLVIWMLNFKQCIQLVWKKHIDMVFGIILSGLCIVYRKII